VNDDDFNDYDEVIMDSVSVAEENNQEIVEQESQEVYEQPTVMSFSFLSTMNHVETPSNTKLPKLLEILVRQFLDYSLQLLTPNPLLLHHNH
jgi:hypothetical protein